MVLFCVNLYALSGMSQVRPSIFANVDEFVSLYTNRELRLFITNTNDIYYYVNKSSSSLNSPVFTRFKLALKSNSPELVDSTKSNFSCSALFSEYDNILYTLRVDIARICKDDELKQMKEHCILPGWG